MDSVIPKNLFPTAPNLRLILRFLFAWGILLSFAYINLPPLVGTSQGTSPSFLSPRMSAVFNNGQRLLYSYSRGRAFVGSSSARRSIVAMSGSDQGLTRFSSPRSVVKKVLARQQSDGDGASVRRSIGRMELRSLDPFLMLDEFSVTPPAGFPDHPHRGFETVTYMLQGAFVHQDFAGNKGKIETGDVQWMTAGRGIVHSEMPATDGANTGLQLWINLSSKDKMIEPKYQELLAAEISRAEKDGVEVRVIAGESMGVKSPVYTRTPAMFLDFTLSPGAEIHQSIPESWNSFVYVLEGEGTFGSKDSSAVQPHNLLVLGEGDGVSAWNKSTKNLRFALIAGQPLNEPVVQHGPFVMNTRAQIEEAMRDYQYGRNGFERAKYWSSH